MENKVSLMMTGPTVNRWHVLTIIGVCRTIQTLKKVDVD